MHAPPAIPKSTARQRSSLVGIIASRAMIRSASVWRFGVVGSNGGAISWSSSIRPVCQKMVDQTLVAGDQASANGTRRPREGADASLTMGA